MIINGQPGKDLPARYIFIHWYLQLAIGVPQAIFLLH
jgi:hypothetical protein